MWNYEKATKLWEKLAYVENKKKKTEDLSEEIRAITEHIANTLWKDWAPSRVV